jgi:uncharacterized membrane protein
MGVTLTCVAAGTHIVNSDYEATSAELPTTTAGLPVEFTALSNGVSAGFNAPAQGVVDQATSFTNTSQYATAYAWDFDDGNFSSLPNPSHTYTQPGVYTIELLSSNLCSSDTFTQTITVGNYAVSQDASMPTQSGAAGETLTYTLNLTNTGTLPDSYNLSLSSSVWSAQLSTATIGPLDPGEASSYQVTVQIPAAQTAASQRNYTVTATSSSDPRLPKASASSAIQANFTPQPGLELQPEQADVSGEPGDVITMTFQLTNTGNLRDSFITNVSGSTWVDVQAGFSALNPGQVVDGLVTVTIPADALEGQSVEATITIRSSHDANIFQQLELTIHVILLGPKIYLPLVVRD